MSHVIESKSASISVCAVVAGLAVLTAAFTPLTPEAAAQELLAAPHAAEIGAADRSLTDLEKTFWLCDHTATVYGVDAGTAMMCVSATMDFKRRKFNGDLNAMLMWWEQNKLREHEAIDSAYRAAAQR